MKTPEHVYTPSCARCRDEAGKDRAKVPDDDLCAWHTTDALTTLRAENERLRADLEQTRVQLAGCGVIAGCNTENSLREQMPAPGSYGYSASLADVKRAVRREIVLRAAATEALAVLTRLADSAASWADYDVPVGIVAEVDAAKARLAGVLGE